MFVAQQSDQKEQAHGANSWVKEFCCEPAQKNKKLEVEGMQCLVSVSVRSIKVTDGPTLAWPLYGIGRSTVGEEGYFL